MVICAQRACLQIANASCGVLVNIFQSTECRVYIEYSCGWTYLCELFQLASERQACIWTLITAKSGSIMLPFPQFIVLPAPVEQQGNWDHFQRWQLWKRFSLLLSEQLDTLSKLSLSSGYISGQGEHRIVQGLLCPWDCIALQTPHTCLPCCTTWIYGSPPCTHQMCSALEDILLLQSCSAY